MQVLIVKKIYTSAYHPQTNSLVEKFNSTLIQMISKSCDVHDRDWDLHLPYLLFAYRASVQEYTGESPLYLVYGTDPRISTETLFSQCRNPYLVYVNDYKEEWSLNLSQAWKNASETFRRLRRSHKSTIIELRIRIM